MFMDNRKQDRRSQRPRAGSAWPGSAWSSPLPMRRSSMRNSLRETTNFSRFQELDSYHQHGRVPCRQFSFFEGMLYLAHAGVSGGYLHGRMARLDPADACRCTRSISASSSTRSTSLINFTEQFQRGYSGFKRFLEVTEVTARNSGQTGRRIRSADVEGQH